MTPSNNRYYICSFKYVKCLLTNTDLVYRCYRGHDDRLLTIVITSVPLIMLNVFLINTDLVYKCYRGHDDRLLTIVNTSVPLIMLNIY